MGDGRTARAERTRELRRRQILDSSLEVFSEKGYWNTSISDLVRAAGVARGTFYLYFDSKQAIFLDLLGELVDRLRGVIKGVDPTAGASVDVQLRAIVVRILETTADNQHLTRIVFREAVGLDAEVEARLTSFYDELRAYLVHALELGVALGLVRESVDRETTAACMLGALRGVVQRYIVDHDDPFDPEAVADSVVQFVVGGIR
ncbi:MAG: AcrR family transcriptional regulator [Myxococcota bacterium]|jgi:AcrR family transcriptional regulator